MKVWVIEIWEKRKWSPTVGCGLTRADARREMKTYWKENYPEYRFRVWRYVPESKSFTGKGKP